MMRNPRAWAAHLGRREIVVGFIFLIALTAWAALLRPPAWGGETGYIVVRGDSMMPVFHPGALVVVRSSSAYQIGDVVAFEVPAGQPGEGAIVIHRIEDGASASGFVVRGDHNPDPDQWRPVPSDILGKAWFSVPLLGRGLALMRSPLALASLAAGVAIALCLVPAPANDTGPRPK